MRQFTGFDVLRVQLDGSERWIDSAESFSAALFQAELAGIESPGNYVIHNQCNGEKEVIKLDTGNSR